MTTPDQHVDTIRGACNGLIAELKKRDMQIKSRDQELEMRIRSADHQAEKLTSLLLVWQAWADHAAQSDHAAPALYRPPDPR